MTAVRRRDTAPERLVRREVHALGIRYFVDRPPLPNLRRRADLVFPRLRIAVFVDGCFWHGCELHRTTPRTNNAWWSEKLARTRRRDADTDARLRDAGWQVLRVWEHDEPIEVARRLQLIVAARRTEAARPCSV